MAVIAATHSFHRSIVAILFHLKYGIHPTVPSLKQVLVPAQAFRVLAVLGLPAGLFVTGWQGSKCELLDANFFLSLPSSLSPRVISNSRFEQARMSEMKTCTPTQHHISPVGPEKEVSLNIA